MSGSLHQQTPGIGNGRTAAQRPMKKRAKRRTPAQMAQQAVAPGAVAPGAGKLNQPKLVDLRAPVIDEPTAWSGSVTAKLTTMAPANRLRAAAFIHAYCTEILRAAA